LENRALPGGRRGSVDEAAFLESLDALLQHAVWDIDPLLLIDFLQPRDQLRFASRLVELAAYEILAMAQRVDHVHRDHQFVQRMRLRLDRSVAHHSPLWSSELNAGPAEAVPRQPDGRCAACHPRRLRGSRPSSAWRACASR